MGINGAILLFADDLTLSGESSANLQRKLNTLNEYCVLNKLMVNTGKTKIIVFQKGGKRKLNVGFKYDKKRIEIVDEYIYLGTLFHKSGNFSRAADYFVSKAK